MLILKDISCGYGGQTLIEGLSLQLTKGSIGALLGPSGCGKTTLLRTIAGFHPLDRGQIELRGVTVAQARHGMAPEQRRIGFVFQDYALFPHLTVTGNIGFGLRSLGSVARTARIEELLNLTGLQDLRQAYPHELSGGQQQRVALARAMAPKPDLLLLDEPFSNLDAEMREQLAQDVQRILRSSQTTALLVTHDQLEAFAMADHIGLLQGGMLHQWDTPYRLYHEPATRYVAGFIGKGVFVAGHMLSPGTAATALGLIHSEIDTGLPTGASVDILIRPDDLIFSSSSPLKARVAERWFTGSTMHYRLNLEDMTQVEIIAPSHHNYVVGQTVGIRLAVDHLIAFSTMTPGP